MSQYSTAALDRTWQRNQNTVRHSSVTKAIGPVSNILIVAILMCILGLIYLTQITKTSSYGYQINELNTQKDELVEENKTLQVESARLQALERIRNSEVAKNLEDAQGSAFVR